MYIPILSPVNMIILQVVVNILLTKVPASNCTRWWATHLATSDGVRWAVDSITCGPSSQFRSRLLVRLVIYGGES